MSQFEKDILDVYNSMKPDLKKGLWGIDEYNVDYNRYLFKGIYFVE